MSIKENNLGSGNIFKRLISLSVPAILAQIINALYNIVDRMFIGHIEGIGAVALTGVGVTFPIIILISAFSSLIGMGGAPRAAIKMGEGRNNEAEGILGNSVVLLFIISIILTILFMIYKEPLLYIFGASDETIIYANQYLDIYLLGTIFVQFALGLNPFINTQGFSKISMITVLIGAVLNIILDPILIFGFNMGVKGAAIATIISQAVSAIWVIKFLNSDKTLLKIKKINFKLKKEIIIPLILLGLSPFIMQATESLVNIAFNSTLQKYGGDNAVGAMTIASSIMQVFTMPLLGLTQGAQPIISYNFGAKNIDRVKKTFKLLLLFSMGISIVIWAALMIFPSIFIGVFTSDESLKQLSVWAIRIYMATVFVMGAQYACQQTFLALGQAKISLFLAVLRKIILLIPLVLILPIKLNLFGVFLSEPIADTIAVTVTVISFAIFYRKTLNEVK